MVACKKISSNLQNLQYTSILISQGGNTFTSTHHELSNTCTSTLTYAYFHIVIWPARASFEFSYVLFSISNISNARYIVYFYSRFVIDHKQRNTDICAAYLCQKIRFLFFNTRLALMISIQIIFDENVLLFFGVVAWMGWMVVAIYRLIDTSINLLKKNHLLQLCIKTQENVQILKLKYMDFSILNDRW